jgi:hypothetical protein
MHGSPTPEALQPCALTAVIATKAASDAKTERIIDGTFPVVNCDRSKNARKS